MWHRCFPYLPAMLKVMPSPYEQPLYASVSCWLFWVYGPPVFSCSVSISTDSSSFCEKTIESGRPSLCLVAAGWAPAPAPTTLKWRAEGNGGFFNVFWKFILDVKQCNKNGCHFFFRQTEESPDLHCRRRPLQSSSMRSLSCWRRLVLCFRSLSRDSLLALSLFDICISLYSGRLHLSTASHRHHHHHLFFSCLL